MIQVTAYLRSKEDHELWKGLSNKTEFLHLALNGVTGKNNLDPLSVKIDTTLVTKAESERRINRQLEPTVPAKVINTKGKELKGEFCPHGHPIPEGRSKCMGKGCKYA